MVRWSWLFRMQINLKFLYFGIDEILINNYNNNNNMYSVFAQKWLNPKIVLFNFSGGNTVK